MTPDRLGATHLGDGRSRFVVWAPFADRVELVFAETAVEMSPADHGYHCAETDAPPGTRYRYRLHRADGEPVERADPASRWQPDGLHGPSAVDEHRWPWTDAAWCAPPLHEQVLYEVHVGTFTPEGTFDAIVPRLPALRELGITTLELMPVWQFPGERNWGYDGVLAYAVQDSYGGPDGLRRLVDAAHAEGLAVVLDVVHNHVGPEGNHLRDFGPYFAASVPTPWGEAINLDGADSDPVRRFVVENAERWITDFHLDGLRLDAVHALVDRSAVHVLESIAGRVHAAARRQGRHAVAIAESDLQDPRLVRSTDRGGYGLDAQWLDDVHHAVHVAVTGERDGYYADYTGLADLWRSLRDRYAIAGRWSEHRRRTVGRPATDVPFDRFVTCIQNHDQVGNRMLGERLGTIVDPERRKVAAATLLLAPFVPMLFMGEEYGETAPFQFFVSHTDADLRDAVRVGRREEFAAFAWQGEAPDPNDVATFERSKLDWDLREHGGHASLLALYRRLLELRRRLPAIRGATASEPVAALHGRDVLSWRREEDGEEIVVVVNLSPVSVRVALTVAGPWTVELDTADEAWDGPGRHATIDDTEDGDPALEVGGTRVVLARRTTQMNRSTV